MNRILIVEDDENLQLLYRSVLERAGFSVVTASKWNRSTGTIRKYSCRIDHYRYHDA